MTGPAEQELIDFRDRKISYTHPNLLLRAVINTVLELGEKLRDIEDGSCKEGEDTTEMLVETQKLRE